MTDKRIRLVVDVPDELKMRVQLVSVKLRRTIQDLVQEAVEKRLPEWEREAAGPEPDRA